LLLAAVVQHSPKLRLIQSATPERELWKSGKPKASFPLSHRHESLFFRNQKPDHGRAVALCPAAGASRRPKSQKVVVVDREK
jgi:hypothetical protein